MKTVRSFVRHHLRSISAALGLLVAGTLAWAYSSEAEAVEEASRRVLSLQGETGREAVAIICYENGEYNVGPAVDTVGDCQHAEFPALSCPAGQPIAVIHSHCADAKQNTFSQSDVAYGSSISVPLFMAETDGDVWALFHHGDPNDPYPIRSGSSGDDDEEDEDEDECPSGEEPWGPGNACCPAGPGGVCASSEG